MMRFFVARPVFCWVIALFLLLFGLIALSRLPVEQYPDIAPPSVSVNASFSGADAQTVDRSVTSIIEQEMNGIDNFLYMSAVSRSNGTAQVTVTLRPGTDLDVARSQVQDRVSRVEPRLPLEVRQLGVTVTASSTGFLMLVALQSSDPAVGALQMGNFAANNIVDELRRIPGVGNVQLFGSAYAMRIWLDRDQLANFALSADQVMAAVQEQNSPVAGGGLGEQPARPGTELTARIVAQGRLSTPEEFRRIIVRATPGGAKVTLGDVARVELGNENYGFGFRVNGKPSAGMAIQLASGANALAVARAVKTRLADLQPTFPAGMSWLVPFDTTPFITISVAGVIRTMVEALLLVTVVVFLFLQKWRATLIPTIVVPVALVGTCIGLAFAGMSINLLSLFAMVVAIGILNDDAIVVVENVERVMRDDGLDAPAATVKAVGEIAGAAVASTLVLVAVFIPMAFFPGATGGIYRQFSVTLSVSILLSTLLALTLGATMSASLLKRRREAAEPSAEGAPDAPALPALRPAGAMARLGERIFGAFNSGMDRMGAGYVRTVRAMLMRPLLWLAVFVLLCGLTGWLFSRLPGSFLPSEDQGNLMVSVIGAPGSTAERTDQALRQAESFLLAQPQVRNVASITGFNFMGQGESAAMAFVDLQPWQQRPGRENSADAVAQRANAAFARVPQAMMFALNPPPIPSLGTASGFTMMLMDRGGAGPAALQRARMQVLAAAAASPVLAGVRPDGLPEAPQLYLEIDRVQARAMGLSIAQVNRTLALTFGAAYVNDFLFEGNVLRVFMQADASQRMRPEDIGALRLPNDRGQMVPFSAFTRVRWQSGPQQLERYNGFPSVGISGQAAPGHSSGAALAEMERIARQALPPGMSFEWTGIAYEEQQAGGQIGLLLALSLVVVFLLLAALYESWSIPVSVLLIVPLGVIGAVLLTMARGMSADVYFNVGLITIIGLAAKNAILIVEFALKEEADGRDPVSAALAAAEQRLRPILMTSVTFVLGMLPLVLASGAGAASRQAVGTGVMGSMLTATALGIFFTPLLYVQARRWLGKGNAAGGPA